MDKKQIVLFDGICSFCNFWVNFIIERDREDKFRFAALQSDTGQNLLKKFNLNTTDFDTFILIDGDKFYSRSTAALKISRQLSGAWKIFYALMVIPGPVRDAVYNLTAKHRYKIFGKREVCRVPTEQEKKKFL